VIRSQHPPENGRRRAAGPVPAKTSAACDERQRSSAGLARSDLGFVLGEELDAGREVFTDLVGAERKTLLVPESFRPSFSQSFRRLRLTQQMAERDLGIKSEELKRVHRLTAEGEELRGSGLNSPPHAAGLYELQPSCAVKSS
jgi:hypothetical protein